jgi:hypothetical protein
MADVHGNNKDVPSGAEIGFEPDHPPTSGISVFVFGTLAIVAASIVGVTAMVKSDTSQKNFGTNPANAAKLEELRQADSEALASYGQVDATRGVYRLPIDVAMKKVVSDPKLLGSLERLLPDPDPTGK